MSSSRPWSRRSCSGEAKTETVFVELTEPLSDQVRALARSNGLTLNTVVQGAWAILLGYLTGRSDVMFGTTVSGRPAEIDGVESIVGLLINTLPIRVRLNPASTCAELLSGLGEQIALLTENVSIGLVELQSLVGLRELFDTMTVLENYPGGWTDRLGDLRITGMDSSDAIHYPLGLAAIPDARIGLRLNYRPDVYDAPAAQAIVRAAGHPVRTAGHRPAAAHRAPSTCSPTANAARSAARVPPARSIRRCPS